MFQEKYQNAYHKIHSNEDTIDALITEAQKRHRQTNIWKKIRPVTAVAAACLMMVLGVPAAAKNISGVYRTLEKHAPNLLEYLIPTQETDLSAGIVMQLEAAKVEGNQAELVVSFTDDGSGDWIRGETDMYDSYNLHSYSGESDIGGCYFMEYDEVEDKAYFQVDLISSDGEFDKEKLEFQVYRLLTDCRIDIEEIPLMNMSVTPSLKAVTLSGRSNRIDSSKLEQYFLSGNRNDPRPVGMVMDIPWKENDSEEISPNTMQVLGTAYMDGMLRVQVFRGEFRTAARHMKLYLLDAAGNQIYPDMSVDWQEEVAGETVSLNECWFVMEEKSLAECKLYGEGDIRQGCVEGDWEITFELSN